MNKDVAIVNELMDLLDVLGTPMGDINSQRHAVCVELIARSLVDISMTLRTDREEQSGR